MKAAISLNVVLAAWAALTTLAFIPSAPSSLGRGCSERSFGGICKTKWGYVDNHIVHKAGGPIFRFLILSFSQSNRSHG